MTSRSSRNPEGGRGSLRPDRLCGCSGLPGSVAGTTNEPVTSSFGPTPGWPCKQAPGGEPGVPAGRGDQRELVARLRAVIEAKDTENAVLRAELQAQRERLAPEPSGQARRSRVGRPPFVATAVGFSACGGRCRVRRRCFCLAASLVWDGRRGGDYARGRGRERPYPDSRHGPVLDRELGGAMVKARAWTVAATAAVMTFSSGCDPLPREMVCSVMSRKLCPAVIMIQVTEALPGSRSM